MLVIVKNVADTAQHPNVSGWPDYFSLRLNHFRCFVADRRIVINVVFELDLFRIAQLVEVHFLFKITAKIAEFVSSIGVENILRFQVEKAVPQ